MRQEWSWARSAREYGELYRRVSGVRLKKNERQRRRKRTKEKGKYLRERERERERLFSSSQILFFLIFFLVSLSPPRISLFRFVNHGLRSPAQVRDLCRPSRGSERGAAAEQSAQKAQSNVSSKLVEKDDAGRSKLKKKQGDAAACLASIAHPFRSFFLPLMTPLTLNPQGAHLLGHR